MVFNIHIGSNAKKKAQPNLPVSTDPIVLFYTASPIKMLSQNLSDY
jgi:hypothetical protein